MDSPQESDWKKYRAMLVPWRERYLRDLNPRIASILTDPKLSETDRFWTAAKLVSEESRVLDRCLGDIRRSQMVSSLRSMREAGIIERDDLAAFSAELRDSIFYDFPQQTG